MKKRKKAKLKLAEILDKKGISKYRFAKMLGKNTSNVFVYFKPGYSPNLSTLERWAEVLNCRIRDLIEE